MSDDFRDIIHTAIEEGFSLDKCGTDERQKMWGRFNDFCGMSVADALAAQSGDDPEPSEKNIITLSMQNDGSGTYFLVVSATYEPAADVVLNFDFEGTTENLTLPAGQKLLTTDLHGSDPNKPYAEIGTITITTTDETYTYESKNAVKNGMFTLTIIKNGEKTTQQVKYGETVDLGTMPPKTGYEFIWRRSDGSVIENGLYTMTEADSTVNGNYERISSTIRILYASVLESEVPSFNNFASMSYIDYVDGDEAAEISFVVPASSDYNRAASELDEDEFVAWMSAHTYDFYIMVPYVVKDDVKIENALHLPVTDTFSVLGQKKTYDGTEYAVYYRKNQSQTGSDSNPITLLISISNS